MAIRGLWPLLPQPHANIDNSVDSKRNMGCYVPLR